MTCPDDCSCLACIGSKVRRADANEFRRQEREWLFIDEAGEITDDHVRYALALPSLLHAPEGSSEPASRFDGRDHAVIARWKRRYPHAGPSADPGVAREQLRILMGAWCALSGGRP